MADSYTGRVCNGVVVFDGGPMPADGTTVRIEPIATPPPRSADASGERHEDRTGTEDLAPGEGLRRSFGAWAEDAGELDEYLEWNRRQRKLGRREIEP